MHRLTRVVLALIVALALVVVAAATSQHWISGAQEDLGQAVIVVVSFISLFIAVTSALAVATFAATVAWLHADGPRRRRDGLILILGFAVTFGAAWYMAFFFGAAG